MTAGEITARAMQRLSASARWGKLTKEERSKRMRAVAMARWKKPTTEERRKEKESE